MENIEFKTGALIKDFIVYEKDEAILIRKSKDERLQIKELYCGDHSLWFIVRYDKNGNELTRYNLRFVAEFEYETEIKDKQ